MPQVLLSNPSTSTRTTGTYASISSSGGILSASAEGDASFLSHIAGRFSGLQVNADATGTGRSVKFRKNTANGNMVVNPTDTTAGVYTDTANTDSIVDGDTFSVGFTSTGLPSYYSIRSVFVGLTTHATFFSAFSNNTPNYTTASTTYYFPPTGRWTAPITTEAITKLKSRVSGKMKNAQVTVSTNGNTNAVTVKNRINGADGTITFSITAATTGRFEDSTHSDAVNSGDDFNFTLTTGAGTVNLTIVLVGCVMDYGASGGMNDVFNYQNGVTRAAGASNTYYPIIGRLSLSSATESQVTVQHGFSVKMSKLRLSVSANTYSAAGTLVLRKNSGNGNQSVSLTAGATGLFEDTTNTDNAIAEDEVCFAISGGTSGSITVDWSGLTEQAAAVSAANLPMLGM